MFGAAVAVSKEWEAGEAGAEIGKAILSKLGRKPSFILLFATIHYAKHGGFGRLLDGVHSVIPYSIPLAGGTVAGFVTRSGSHTRGAAALAIFDDQMDVAVASARDTKRKPNFAAQECARSLDEALAGSKYKHKHFFTMVSSAVVPNLPFIGGRHVIRHKPGIELAAKLFAVLSSALQIGPGRDDEIFKAFCNGLKGWGGIGGAACDDLRLERNYQFIGDSVLTNSIVALGIAREELAMQRTSLGIRPSHKSFTVTKTSGNGYVIEKINGKPAVPEYLRIMGWGKTVLDERLYRKVFYFPFVTSEGDIPEPRMFGLAYGNSFVCPIRVLEGKSYEIHVSTGQDLIGSITGLVDNANYRAGLLVSCGTRLETLGSNIELARKKLAEHFSDDFLGIFTAGEYAKNYDMYSVCMYQSDNALLF